MKQYPIRKMEPKDHDKVGIIWLAGSILTHDFISPKTWCSIFNSAMEEIKSSDESHVCYDPEKNGIVIGFITFYKKVAQRENYIPEIFVEPQYQCKGVGKALLDEIKKGKDFLSVDVYEKNISAIKFYKKNGFDQEGKRRLEDETMEFKILMKWKNKDKP